MADKEEVTGGMAVGIIVLFCYGCWYMFKWLTEKAGKKGQASSLNGFCASI